MLQLIRKYRWVAYALAMSSAAILIIGFHWGPWALLAGMLAHATGGITVFEFGRLFEIEQREARMQIQEDLEQLDDQWHAGQGGEKQ